MKKITTFCNIHFGRNENINTAEGLIEPDKEITRIDKLINKLQTELNSITSKLNNDNFIENAPQELVNQQRDRSNYLSNEINKLEIQHKEITKLI